MGQLTVSTVVPGGCSTVMTALVKAMSVMFSVQLVLGQSGAPGNRRRRWLGRDVERRRAVLDLVRRDGLAARHCDAAGALTRTPGGARTLLGLAGFAARGGGRAAPGHRARFDGELSRRETTAIKATEAKSTRASGW
jgi:hypothetical protein